MDPSNLNVIKSNHLNICKRGRGVELMTPEKEANLWTMRELNPRHTAYKSATLPDHLATLPPGETAKINV